MCDTLQKSMHFEDSHGSGLTPSTNSLSHSRRIVSKLALQEIWCELNQGPVCDMCLLCVIIIAFHFQVARFKTLSYIPILKKY